MTSPISKIRLFAVVLTLFAAAYVCNAQESQMRALIGQSLSKLRQEPSPEAFLNCISELKRIDAMYPDSAAVKYQMALQSLNYSVMNPHSEQTEGLLDETEQLLSAMEQMPAADRSDLFTLKGFWYMVRIVQDPAQNGARYYRDVIENYEKALKINPDNALAQQLQSQFREGMAKAMQ